MREPCSRAEPCWVSRAAVLVSRAAVPRSRVAEPLGRAEVDASTGRGPGGREIRRVIGTGADRPPAGGHGTWLWGNRRAVVTGVGPAARRGYLVGPAGGDHGGGACRPPAIYGDNRRVCDALVFDGVDFPGGG
jgi:hypothetical protein